MYYTVYQITNTINGMIYVGVHRTENLSDGYMGSGLLLVEARRQYGPDAFTKKILKVFDNADDMFNMEAEIVDQDFIRSKQTYNLMKGGPGGPKEARETKYYKSGEHKKNILEVRQTALANIKANKQVRIKGYYINPTQCANCNAPLPYEKKRNKFCSKSCSASANNRNRVITNEHKANTSKTMKEHSKKLAAGVVQPVERNVANVEVEGSSPSVRSNMHP